MLDKIGNRIRDLVDGDIDHWKARLVNTSGQYVRVRQNVLEPVHIYSDLGLYVEVTMQGGTAYAATDNLSTAGIKQVLQQAKTWAGFTAQRSLTQFALPSNVESNYSKKAKIQPDISGQIDFLTELNRSINIHEYIVDWASSIHSWTSETLLISSDHGRIYQEIDYIIPSMYALANLGSESQRRSVAGSGLTGGLEQLEKQGMTAESAASMAQQAIDLLAAENCPSLKGDLLLMPSQMMLQIHESIGHPLELDRILGDERNYAGTSFVKLDMFGKYRYGSPHLNISFSPGIEDEMASYACDDDGSKAEKVLIIENGILQRPLGGRLSQSRAGLSTGTANSRACNWNRPPIDRMANLNLEPSTHALKELIGNMEYGILMDTNLSWSIDDSRNKFQFGCEFGQVVKDGEVKYMVKNPNYRGISANFWRNLTMVGDVDSFEIWGTPNCGKGEPNQMVHVGHASPPCLFSDVEIFGGD